MNKQELEELNNRLYKHNEVLESIIYDIKQQMVYAADIYQKGLAEETDFNLGIQHALAVVSDIINSKIRSGSYLHCPSFRNVIEEEQKPVFTIIEGGLSKKYNKSTR